PAAVRDPLPAWATFVSASVGGTNASGEFEANIGPLAGGAVTTITVTVEITDSASMESLVNTVYVNDVSFDSQTNAIIGNYVWDDVNTNGVQDVGEGGISNVTVTLLNSNSIVVASTVTDTNGMYQLIVVPGAYAVQFSDLPTNTNFTIQDSAAGNDMTDSDVNPVDGITAQFSVSGGETNDTIDAGIISDPPDIDKTASPMLESSGDALFDYIITVSNVTDQVVNPAVVRDELPEWATFVSASVGGTNASGDYEHDVGPLAGSAVTTITVTVEVTDPNSVASLINTASLNNLTFDTQANAVIGNYVWDDVNTNGVQDAGEAGVSNITVNLLNSTGGVVAVTTTDASGLYQFIAVPDTYAVEFTDIPTNTSFTLQDSPATNDMADSDANASGLVAPFTVSAGEINDTIDAGLVGDPPDVDKSADPLVASTGDAEFDYVITVSNVSSLVVNPAVVRDPLPAWATFVSATVGGTNASGEFEVDIGPLAGGAVTTISVTVQVTDPDSMASLINTVYVNDVSFDTQANAVIGNYVWDDVNTNGVQDAGELGVSNVTVNLLNSNSTIVASTTTDPAGLYQFIVVPDTYSVEFADIPTNTSFTTQDVPGDDTADSDADVFGLTAPFSVSAGETNDTIDAGLAGDSPDVDKDANPLVASTGDAEFDYVITVSNVSSLVVNPAAVRDPLPAWATFVSASVGGTNASGEFEANIGPLAGGAVTTITVTV
ncbi:MAG: DUF11 domain-containing protein, partial [Sulfitobacter sp.]|nr:DUF11 domain-containing protein [Sulfitobacter sp.]